MAWPNDTILRQINRLLLVIIMLSNGFVLLAPLLPNLTFSVRNVTKPQLALTTATWFDGIDRSYNHIIIPRLYLDEKIHEGNAPETAHLGVWRRPNTDTPGNGSNTVMVGHRFTYDGDSVFYHLNKVAAGDDVVVVWEGDIFVYKVNAQLVVPATAVHIESATDDELLTLYTCTPIWSARDRLVVTADLTERIGQ